MNRPLMIDLYCKQGGTSMGYWRAGWDVVAVDKDPQPRFPEREGLMFVQADALAFIREHGLHYLGRRVLARAGSPPCQFHSKTQRIRGRVHPELITKTRAEFEQLPGPYIIENVPEARPFMRDPVTLCGPMFGLDGISRDRLFEAGGGLTLDAPPCPGHPAHTKMGRPPEPGRPMHVVGNFSDVEEARRRMGIDWMTREGLREAIPPAYTEFLGRQMLAAVFTRDQLAG